MIDTDGSPVAYHPDNKGTTHLCNGLDPIVAGKRISDKRKGSPCYDLVQKAIEVNWNRASSPTFCAYGFYAKTTLHPQAGCQAWGGEFGVGEIPRQRQDDPAPGFFISTTSTLNPGQLDQGNQRRYLNADTTPYAVVPGHLLKNGALSRGGLVFAWNPQSRKAGYGIVGDSQNKFGEISVAFAQTIALGEVNPISPSAVSGTGSVPWPYGRRPNSEVRVSNAPKGPVVFVYFSKRHSPTLSSYTVDQIGNAGAQVLSSVGGVEAFGDCLRKLLK